jgi:hypothetical protein
MRMVLQLDSVSEPLPGEPVSGENFVLENKTVLPLR